ncbi:MAG: hypothetical protein L0I62_10120, partial [Gammaproteobacteria bacterium]|nr:hypothetical protein [Gammaproteobacteria bacterium]
AIAVVEVSGTGMLLATKYLHRNGQGSVVAVTDGAGTLLSRSAWGAYFTPWRPLISRHGGHPFHLMAATDFTPCRPPP